MTIIKTAHKRGDIRVRRRFAFFPKMCIDGKVRWLEYLLFVEEYSTYGPEWLLSEWSLRSVRPIKKEGK